MRSKIQRMVLFAVGFLLIPALACFSPGFASANSSTLDRNADPVVITGAKFAKFLGKPLDQLFVYAYSNGRWQQIPWQFDETVDGAYVAADNLLLDKEDELVFMGMDTGDRAASYQWVDNASAAENPRYEVMVIDPLAPAKTAWVYVYHSTTLDRAKTADYVDYHTPTSTFTSAVYVLGFHPLYIAGNRLEMNGSGINVLDRSKWRFAAEGMESVWNEESIEGEPDDPRPLILDGRVRAISGYQALGQGLMTIAYRSQFFDLFTLDLSWSPRDLAWLTASADFNEEIIGGIYYDANTPLGVTVDGQPDTLQTTPATQWQQISSSTGTVFHAIEASRMKGTHATYYKDDASFDSEDSGDGKSYGDMGITISQPIKGIFGSLTHYILPPNSPNVGSDYYDYFLNPLQSKLTLQQKSSRPASATPIIDLLLDKD